jgi:hypothetical protein
MARILIVDDVRDMVDCLIGELQDAGWGPVAPTTGWRQCSRS